jgi:hypothetical protein
VNKTKTCFTKATAIQFAGPKVLCRSVASCWKLFKNNKKASGQSSNINVIAEKGLKAVDSLVPITL